MLATIFKTQNPKRRDEKQSILLNDFRQLIENAQPTAQYTEEEEEERDNETNGWSSWHRTTATHERWNKLFANHIPVTVCLNFERYLNDWSKQNTFLFYSSVHLCSVCSFSHSIKTNLSILLAPAFKSLRSRWVIVNEKPKEEHSFAPCLPETINCVAAAAISDFPFNHPTSIIE